MKGCPSAEVSIPVSDQERLRVHLDRVRAQGGDVRSLAGPVSVLDVPALIEFLEPKAEPLVDHDPHEGEGA